VTPERQLGAANHCHQARDLLVPPHVLGLLRAK